MNQKNRPYSPIEGLPPHGRTQRILAFRQSRYENSVVNKVHGATGTNEDDCFRPPKSSANGGCLTRFASLNPFRMVLRC